MLMQNAVASSEDDNEQPQVITEVIKNDSQGDEEGMPVS